MIIPLDIPDEWKWRLTQSMIESNEAWFHLINDLSFSRNDRKEMEKD